MEGELAGKSPNFRETIVRHTMCTRCALHYSTGGRGRKLGYIDWEDWNWITRNYERELVMWAAEYAERFGQQGITAVSVHPGDSVTRGQGVLFYPFLQLQFGTECRIITGDTLPRILRERALVQRQLSL
ncbi:hypothetical protein AK812_SmicGene7100 [Symbiodinium microadriaticum]|uniref:Uncharacterized protein n=1 Tax=Symbiodinium microadriaticum TaxID=2951 RepID=A0A1Q9EPD3_SYMMI|nr:hypothetical protein AK812_SmicGene7100 [Symbiodinium microadriaticum]